MTTAREIYKQKSQKTCLLGLTYFRYLKDNVVLFESLWLLTKKVSTQTVVCSMWFWTTNVTITKIFWVCPIAEWPQMQGGAVCFLSVGWQGLSLVEHLEVIPQQSWAIALQEEPSVWQINGRACVTLSWGPVSETTAYHWSDTRWVTSVGTQLRWRIWWLYSFSFPFYLCPYSSVSVALCSPCYCSATVWTLRMLSSYDHSGFVTHTCIHTHMDNL